MLKVYKILLLALSFAVLSKSYAQQPTLSFKASSIENYIGKYLSTFEDTSNKLSFEEIVKRDSLFKASNKEVPDFGVAGNTNWIRFQVRNQSDQNFIFLNLSYPPIDEVVFFVVKGHVCSQIPKLNRKHQFFIYKIDIKNGETATCYLKLRSNKQLIVPITLETSQSLMQMLTDVDAFSGLYLGIMFVMILYNLFIYFSAKDKQYLYYVNYILWVTLAQASLLGYTEKFLWVRGNGFSNDMLTLFGALSGIGTVMFVKYFLSTRKYTPKSNVVLNLIICADVVAILLLLSGYAVKSYQVVNIIAALGAIIIFATAIQVYFKNKKPASYFLTAWSIFLLSVLVFVLKDFGVFSYNFLTVHSVQIGSAVEAVLLSFALADRINTLKKEKDQSRLEALRIAKENSRIIKEQNVQLEIKVKERTEELMQKNEELNTTLEDLQEAQIQLVESEKMASLGQLTAGIAHEINNPINFVTGNIAPLRRDVDILFQTISTIEGFNTQDISDQEKIERTKAYKQEQDFDYLKMEIGHLLKGINEGASRTAEIVKSLRIFSRLDEDDLKLADINEGLESTLIIINNLLNRTKVVKRYSNLPLVNCYPGKLNQVFLNIISNCLFAINQKFGDRDGGELTVATRQEGSDVLITIADNGTGMDETTKRKIFDPFFTTKDVGQGTGLGMSIVFNTIQKHKGHIAVTTAIDIGTQFELTIPINELV